MKTLKYMGMTTTLAAGILFVPAAFAQAGGATPDNSGQSSSSAQSGSSSGTTSSSSAQSKQGTSSSQSTTGSTGGTSDTGATSQGTSGNLPKTASEFPLVGLAGLLSAAGAMTLRKLAKKS